MDAARPVSTVGATLVVVGVTWAIMCGCVSAVNYTVGGSTGWDLSSNISDWSASQTFFVNDSLVFVYNLQHDVIEVSKAGFSSCQTNSPIAVYTDGETFITLSQPGQRYYVCGKSDHCSSGLKLRVKVLDQRTSPSSGSQSPPSNNSTDQANHHDVAPVQQPPSDGSGSPKSSNGHRDADLTTFTRFVLTVALTSISSWWIYRILF